MSNHLRHCPKHKLRKPCPHCALVQKPAVVEVAAPDPPITAPEEVVLPVQPVAKKRGRPPKGDRAMTDAERKREQRKNAGAKQEDKERRNLIAKIARKLRVGRSVPKESLSVNSLAEKIAADVNDSHTMMANLKNMSIAELQKTYDSLKTFSDTTGTLPGERSGEKDRKDGQSEIENLVGVIEYAPAQVVRPEGYGPDSSEKRKPSLDKADTPKIKINLPSNPDVVRELMLEAIERMTADKTTCGVCGLVCESTEKLSLHLNERYETGMKQLEWLEQLKEFSYGMENQIADTQAKIAENRHPLAIQILMTSLEKEKKKKGRLARRLERKGKQAANKFKAEERDRLAQQAETEGWGVKDKTKSPGERQVDPDPPTYPRLG